MIASSGPLGLVGRIAAGAGLTLRNEVRRVLYMNHVVPSLRRRASGARVVLIALAASGCLGPTSSDSDGPPCTITITGASAIAGTYTCSQRAVAIWVTSTNVGYVSLNLSGTKSITGLFAFPGQPTAGTTYTTEKNPSTLQSYGFLVSAGSTSTWEFSAGQSKTPLGSGTLTLSSVSAGPPSATGVAYIVHGTIDGNLVPSPGTQATGTATIHIDF